MKTIRFTFFLIITLALILTLDSKISIAPPLGKFLSPFHGFTQNDLSVTADDKPDFRFKQLQAPVKVYYDELNIPHIYAENENDLRFVQGYLTAKDRLWQMDFFTRIVFGRVAEVVGERALDYDRTNLRIGLKMMTERFFEKIQEDEQMMAVLEAYSAGVNAYIDELSYEDYPIEFKLLDYQPENWTPIKSTISYAMLSNTLSKGEADLENTNFVALFGREMFNLLFPEQLGNLAPVIPQGTKWNFTAPPLKIPEGYPLRTLTNELIERPHPLNGSNNFAVDGTKSASGHVLLANELDLSLTLPSIWHACHLHTPELNVMGVTVPGTPVVLVGFNDSIAWGLTNSPRDQVDWFSVRFKDATRKEYYYNQQWFKTDQVVEEIEIRGESPFYDTIYYVHHGPVVYGRNFKPLAGDANYAMKWVAHEPGNSLKALHEINKAHNYDEFTNALQSFAGPPQNFIFSSQQGTIALRLPGKFPIKWEEQGKFLLDGSDPRMEWQGFIPFDYQLQIKNPKSGFLFSANQHPVDSLYPYYVYDHNYEYYRNRRIRDRLSAMQNIEPKDLMKLQHDNYNFQAYESLPMMLDSLDTASFPERERNYYQLLRQWDYFSNPDLKAPTLYELWSDILYDQLWDELDTVRTAKIKKPEGYVTIHLLKTRPTFPFSDLLSTPEREGTGDLINLTYSMALDTLESWIDRHDKDFSWGRFKNTTIGHLLQIESFSRSQVPIGGNHSIVNAAARSHGPTWRMVVELTPEGPKAWGVYPGSQTGHPGHPMYGHMIDAWATGEYFQLLFGQDISASEQITDLLTFEPEHL